MATRRKIGRKRKQRYSKTGSQPQPRKPCSWKDRKIWAACGVAVMEITGPSDGSRRRPRGPFANLLRVEALLWHQN
jgi:hypothetical protein